MFCSRVVVVVLVAFLCHLAAARAIQTMLLLNRGMMDALLRLNNLTMTGYVSRAFKDSMRKET